MLPREMGDTRFDAFRTQSEHQPVVAELAFRPGDPVVVGEVLQIDLRPVRERVVGRHRYVRRVVEQFGHGETAGHRQPLVAPVEHHRQVDISPQHGPDSGLGFQFRCTYPQFGVVRVQ